MSIILRLQNLPWAANSLDIRRYFQNLSIPEGGVHIVGGEKGDAFIAFTTDEDARQAMERDGGKVKECKIKLMLSSRLEMQKVIEQARSHNPPSTPSINTPPVPAKAKENDRSPDRNRRSSPDRRRERERSPRDRDRDSKSKKSSSSSSRKDKSRSRSPARRNRDRDRDRDRERDRDFDRRSKRDDKKKTEETPKSRDDISKHDNILDNRSSLTSQGVLPGIVEPNDFALARQAALARNTGSEAVFGTPLFQQKQNIEPWIDKIPVWEDGRQGGMSGVNNQEMLHSGAQQDLLAREQFGRRADDRTRFGLPAAFEGPGVPRRTDPFSDNAAFNRPANDDTMGKSFRAFDSDQRMNQTMPRQNFEEQGFPPNPSKGLGFCVEVRGLPFSVSYKDVRDIFRGLFIPSDGLKLINDDNGQRTGTAIIRLTNQRDVNEALKRNKQYVGDGLIDVFRCTDNIFDQAVDSYLPPGMKKPLHFPPRQEDLVVLLKGLPFQCKEDDVINFFDGLRILDLYIDHDANGRASGSGFVEFGTPEDFHVAMSMNRRTIGHRYIDLVVSSKEMMMASRNERNDLSNQSNLSVNDRDRLMGNKELLPLPQSENRHSFCIAMQGLSFNVTDRDIADFFGDIGIPLAIHIMLNQERMPTGEAFVEFATVQQFQIALNRSGKCIGPNMIKIVPISYDEMTEVLGNPVGRNEPLLNRPLNESRGKEQMEDQDMMSRSLLNRSRLGLRDMDDSNNSRMSNDSRFSMRDQIQGRGFPGEGQDNMPMRGFQDDMNFRGPMGGNRDVLQSRNFMGDSRNFSGRGIMDGMDRMRGFMDRNVGRMSEGEVFDDTVRNRRPGDIGGQMRMTDSPDLRGRAPMDRNSDMSHPGRHILDTPQGRRSDDMNDSRGPMDFGPGMDNRMPRGHPNQNGPGLNDRRRMMPGGGVPNAGGGQPDNFGKPGCVIGANNIPYRASVDDILNVFKDYGLSKDNVLRRYDNMGRVTGDARISFQKPEDAKKAVAELNGTMLNGRTVSLFFA